MAQQGLICGLGLLILVGTRADVPAKAVLVDVLGSSGKFTVYDEAKGKASGVQITMDSLKEVDVDGNAVGTSGANKHSINTFAPQVFTIMPAVEVDLGEGLFANKIAFSSPIAGVGQIQVDTYVMSNVSRVGPPGEKWEVARGDMKWNVNISSWTWCGCKQGGIDEVGEFIDLTVTVKGMGKATKSDKSNKTIALGAGAELLLSGQVEVDGTWVNMATGYPKVTTTGSMTMLTFRFPKFTDYAFYDPLITGVIPLSASVPQRIVSCVTVLVLLILATTLW